VKLTVLFALFDDEDDDNDDKSIILTVRSQMYHNNRGGQNVRGLDFLAGAKPKFKYIIINYSVFIIFFNIL